MHSHQAILVILAAISISALPLNINLGAFSPALVVGDGEISFGGAENAAALMTALSTGSQTAAAGTGTAAETLAKAPATPAKGSSVTIATTLVSPTPGPSVAPETVVLPQGMGKALSSETVEDIGPRADGSAAEKRAVEIETRNIKEREAEVEKREIEVEKRDLAGFNAALAFAAAALKTSPEVQLGTGAEGSGVGILQKAGGTPSAAAVKVGKREVGQLPTVTMIKVRTIGDSSALTKDKSTDFSSVVAREVEADDVNLNLAGDGQEYELTIAEVKP